MYRIFARDIVISVLLAIITSLLLNNWWLLCMSEPYLFIVLYVEQFEERLIRVQRMKKSIEKLRKRKVLPPTKAMQDNPKKLHRDYTTEKERIQ